MLVNKGRELAAQVWGVTHGSVPVTNDSLGNQRGEVLRILPTNSLNGNGNVGGGDSIISQADFGPDEFGLRTTCRSRGHRVLTRLDAGKVLLGKCDKSFVGDPTSTDKDHAVSLVVCRDIVGQVLSTYRQDVLLGAEDGAAKWLTLERRGVKVVEDDLLELLVDLLLLTEDDIALTLDGRFIQFRILQDVGKDLD